MQIREAIPRSEQTVLDARWESAAGNADLERIGRALAKAQPAGDVATGAGSPRRRGGVGVDRWSRSRPRKSPIGGGATTADVGARIASEEAEGGGAGQGQANHQLVVERQRAT